MTQPAFTNRLTRETSPYLRQHAHNPVDWFPWGEEALRKARELDRPIFLSIGYSACHWCHVMEHESFEDPEIGKYLNEHFVSIKVDREERPDLDQIYMTAVQLMTRHGGWPMSVFLTPDLQPFYGGTYFPPADRYNLPSFQRILMSIAKAWQEQRAGIAEQAAELTNHIQQAMRVEAKGSTLSLDLLKNALAALRPAFDSVNGGFGDAPKFPHPMDLRLLLRIGKRFGDDHALHMVQRTLDGMALGGMYDHLGGGFHRYSTDARWLAPHFEKMLYDNALLSLTYLEAYQATHDPFYREVVEETLAYVLREMTSPEGPFYSTQDADSEGVEGKFFVWSAEEIERLLGKERAALFASVYDVTPEGNWEEHNILHRSRPYAVDAKLHKMSEADLRKTLNECKAILLAERGKRIWPARDEKTLTAWNGLMIASFAKAYQVLEKPEYLHAASRAAKFLLEKMRTPDGRLLRTWGAGSEPKLNGYLEDCTYFLDALVSLYEATFDPAWIASALDLGRVMIEQFWDHAGGGFFYTGRDHETLIARTKDPHDSSTPSANGMAATALLRLAKLTGRADLQEKAVKTLELFAGQLRDKPHASGQMLIALDFHLGPVREVAVIGDPGAEETQQALGALRQGFYPNQVLAGTPAESTPMQPLVGLLEGKTRGDKVTVYFCENFACKAPLVGVEAVLKELGT